MLGIPVKKNNLMSFDTPTGLELTVIGVSDVIGSRTSQEVGRTSTFARFNHIPIKTLRENETCDVFELKEFLKP